MFDRCWNASVWIAIRVRVPRAIWISNVLRRLTNAEYTYTVRDLTGVDLNPASRCAM